jgi:ANTAR domain
MVSPPPPTQVGLVAESLNISSRVAELEAEIAQLKDALKRRQQIGVAVGLLAQRFAISPERAWSLLVRLSQNGNVKVREIAEAVIAAHCGQLDPAKTKLISSIEKYLPDGIRLVQTTADRQRTTRDAPQ